MNTPEVVSIIEAIAKVLYAPLIAVVCYILKQWHTQHQSIKLEKIKLENEKIKITHLKNKELQNNMSEEKMSILMTWQNLHNSSIVSSGMVEASIDERISLFMNPITKKVNSKNVKFKMPLGELVSQTLVYSFSPQVHKYVEKMMLNSYELNTELEKVKNEVANSMGDEELADYKLTNSAKSMAYTFAIYHFLSLEWQGIDISETSIDIIGNVYLRDYYFGNSDLVNRTKKEMVKIKEEEGIIVSS